jgi:unspecific monooxygenase
MSVTDAGGPPGGPPAFDLFSPEARADPYPGYRRLRETAPVLRHPFGFWLLSGHRDCAALLRDPVWGHGDDRLGQVRGLPIDPGERATRSFLRLDPPDHTRLRTLVAKAFTPRVVERLTPRIEALTAGLLDRALTRDSPVDLVEALAYPLPVAVISELLGVPSSDEDRFRAWSAALARGLDPPFLLTDEENERRERAAAEFSAYLRELVAERHRHATDDLLGRLVRVEEGGERLSEAELLATCILLLAAGHETTANLIGNATLALLRDRPALERFRAMNTAGQAAAVEELLRWDAPVQVTARVALTATELDGHRIEPGEFAILLLGAANRDPEAFAEPERLELGRFAGRDGQRARHLSFGSGIHFCLGAPLARLEGRTALAALLDRAPGLELAGEPVRRENFVLRGLSALPVTLR